MDLCTLANVRQHMNFGAGDTDHDAFFNLWIPLVSGALGIASGRMWRGRSALAKRTITQKFNVQDYGVDTLFVAASPIVSISEIKEALYGAYASATALVENTDYQMDSELGALFRVGNWMRGKQSVRVTYIGGYTLCDPWTSGSNYSLGDLVHYEDLVYAAKGAIVGLTTPPPDDAANWDLQTGEIPLPGDITRAAVMQVVFEHQRRNKLGVTGAGVQGASFQSYARDDLLPGVKRTMRAYRRMLA